MISSEDIGRSSQAFKFQVGAAERPRSEPIYDDYGEELFTAGQIVAAGTYLEVDSGRQVTLDRSGPLPASLNGRRAFYSRLERPWATTVVRTVVNSRN